MIKHILFPVALLLSSIAVYSQIDTASFPEQRLELLQLLHTSPPGKEKSCGDLVAVGPKGDLTLSRQQWIEAQKKQKLVFRSLKIVPGSEIIRVYDKTTGVVNYLAVVALTVAGKDIEVKVRRLEVYHYNGTTWCMVAGQGTEVDEKIFPIENGR